MNQIEMNLCDRHGGSLPAIFTENIRPEDTPETLAKYAEEVLRYYKVTNETNLTVYLSSSKMYFDALLTAIQKIGAPLRVGIWQNTGGSNGFYHFLDIASILPTKKGQTTYDVRLCAWPETRANHLSPEDTENPVNWQAVIGGRLENPFNLRETERIAEEKLKQFAGKHILVYVNGADFVFVPVVNAMLRLNCIVTLQHYNPSIGISCFHTINLKESL